MKKSLIVFAVLILFGATFIYYRGWQWKAFVNSSEVPTPSLPQGISEGQFEEATKWLRNHYPAQPASREAVLMVLAEQLVKQANSQLAIRCYREVATQVPRLGLAARFEEGKLLVELNRADEAETCLLEYLSEARIASELQPEQVRDAFKWLTYVLSVEIRQEERKELLLEQHRIGLADPLDSKQLYFPNLLILNSPAGKKRIASFIENDPKNIRLRLANARYRTLEGNYDASLPVLREMYQESPGNLQVAAALAESLFESGDMEGLQKLNESLPNQSEGEPWLLSRMRGEAALESKQWEIAIEAFNQVLRNDPTNAPAQMGIGKAWAGLGNETKRQETLQRSAIIAEIRVNLSSVQPNAANACVDLVDKCTQLGLVNAAEAFQMHAKTIAEQK